MAMARNQRGNRDWRLLATAVVATLVLLVDLSLILFGGAVASGLLPVG
jgi:hypothetical protein